MKIKFALMGILLVSGLAGCAGNVVNNPISPTAVFDLESGYGVLQSAAVGYSRLKRCTESSPLSSVNICSEQGIINSLGVMDGKARVALQALENFVKNPSNYPGLTYSSLYSAAKDAIEAFKQIEQIGKVS